MRIVRSPTDEVNMNEVRKWELTSGFCQKIIILRTDYGSIFILKKQQNEIGGYCFQSIHNPVTYYGPIFSTPHEAIENKLDAANRFEIHAFDSVKELANWILKG